MSVQSQINRIKANVADSYAAVSEKGGVVPETQNSGNLAEAINSIPTGGDTYLVNAPIGAIIVWSGTEDSVPQGWSICNGENGTLDLRDKFVLGAGTHEVGETGGSEEVTLTVEQMPQHRHNIYDGAMGSGTTLFPYVSVGSKTGSNRTNSADIATFSGGNNPHPNMPPYYTALYIQKTGVTPSDYATIEDINNAIGNINAILDTINGEVV